MKRAIIVLSSSQKDILINVLANVNLPHDLKKKLASVSQVTGDSIKIQLNQEEINTILDILPPPAEDRSTADLRNVFNQALQ
jgi:hypothetical protein